MYFGSCTVTAHVLYCRLKPGETTNCFGYNYCRITRVKFILALLATFIVFTLPAQMLVFDRELVSLDSVPCTFTQSGNWIWKHRTAHFWCSVDGNVPVRIDSVYKYTGTYRWPEHKSNFTMWPDLCEPGKSYEILLDVSGYSNAEFEFITGTGQRISVHVLAESPALDFSTGTLNNHTDRELDGRVHETVRELVNTSAVPVTVDSIVTGNKAWSLQTPVPFVLQPGAKKSISIRYCGVPSPTNGSTTLYYYIFHRKQGGLTDMLQGTVYLGFFHAVMIEGSSDSDFGRVNTGDTLRAKILVRNNGITAFALKKNARPGVSFAEDSLQPGDTATALVSWNVAMASGVFRMELPLFYDVRNQKSTAIFHAKIGRGLLRREKSVSPDSLIWTEAGTIDLDTVYRSKGQLNYDIKLRNNSSSPILVTRTTTGDGGSMADGPRQPIQPGEEFVVRFHQDLSSRNVINRSVNIQIQFLDSPGVTINKVVTITAVVADDEK